MHKHKLIKDVTAETGRLAKRAIFVRLMLASGQRLRQKCESNSNHRFEDGFFSVSLHKQKSRQKPAFLFVVRETGIEPVWHNHTPLKRARLPIPPLSQMFGFSTLPTYYTKTLSVCQYFFCIFFKKFYPKVFYKNLIVKYKRTDLCRPFM